MGRRRITWVAAGELHDLDIWEFIVVKDHSGIYGRGGTAPGRRRHIRGPPRRSPPG